MRFLHFPRLLLTHSPNDYWDVLFTLFRPTLIRPPSPPPSSSPSSLLPPSSSFSIPHSSCLSPTTSFPLLSPLNLMLGHPNWDPPPFLFQNSHLNEKDLIKILCREYRDVLNRNLDETNIAITMGANFALYAALLSLVRKGGEVLCFEPFYPEYFPQTLLTGGTFRGIPFIPPPARIRQKNGEVKFEKEKDEWKINWALLKKRVNTRTRVLILNNPHNPTGKVFTDDELEEIADIVRHHPKIVVINDEVYENCVYDGKMSRFGRIKGMFERTINVYSAGKTFAVTGIRVGWAIGPPNLIEPLNVWTKIGIGNINQPILSSIANVLLHAREPYLASQSYYEESRRMYKSGRDQTLKYIMNGGINFKFWVPQSGYFIICDFNDIEFDPKYYYYNEEKRDFSKSQAHPKDLAFALWLGIEKKIVGTPMTIFFSQEHEDLGFNMIRFACCKSVDYLKPLEACLN